MKKLAIITTHPIQYYAPIFQLLAERGQIEIMVFYTWGERVLSKFDPGFGIPVAWDIPVLQGYPYTWAENRARDPGTHHFGGIHTPGLVGQVLRWKPDAVLIFGWSWRGHLRAMRAFKHRIPVFFRGDSTLLNERGGLKGRLKTVFLKWVYRHIDVAFYVGTNNQAYFRRYGVGENQLVFAPHATDNDRFRAEPAGAGDAIRNSLGIRPDEVLLLYAGKFEEVKNVALLLDVFQQLAEPAVHLLLVGNGPLEAALKAAGDHPRVHFMDFRNQTAMPAIYLAADLFCLPSLSESWGLTVNEAMACGRAVLVSDRVGCAADLVSEANGAVFRSGSHADLLRRLTHLIRSRKELQAMGHCSAQRIAEWNFERIADAIEQQVLSGKENS